MIRGSGWDSLIAVRAGARPRRRFVVKEITFRVHGFTGWDVFLGLLPERWQARLIARRLLRESYRGLDLGQVRLVVLLPRGAYRVLDDAGRVELVTGDPAVGQLP